MQLPGQRDGTSPSPTIVATRMRSILDTRPKGAPGRDKPLPFDRCYENAGHSRVRSRVVRLLGERFGFALHPATLNL